MVCVSLASIPPRIENGHLFKCIDALLQQTIKPKYILINLVNNYKRFGILKKEYIEKIKNYHESIIIQFDDYDSPLLKYLGIPKCSKIDDNEWVFVGDDDQEYKNDILEKMLKSTNIDQNGVYQNRYFIVRNGTAGIVHGFVGLMMRKEILKKLVDFDKPDVLWVDDQFMTIYFYKNNYTIYPTLIHNFNEIYKTLGIFDGEKVATGGDLCLDVNTNKRNIEIRNLEIKYNIFFCDKMKNEAKGIIKDIDWSKEAVKNIILVYFGKITDKQNNNMNKLFKLYKHCNFEIFNELTLENEYNIKINDLLKYPSYHYNYYIDKIGMDKCKELKNSIYINLDIDIDDNFDIYEYLFNDKNLYIINDKIIFRF